MRLRGLIEPIILQGNPRIDSFSLLIPEELFVKIPMELSIPIHIIQNDVLLDEKKPYFQYNYKGVKLKVSYKVIPLKENRFLEFVITSKMIFGKYFEGLNENNINTALINIEALGFVLMPNVNIYEHCYIYDLDICIDFEMSHFEFSQFCYKFKELTNENQRVKIYEKRKFEKDNDLGKQVETIQINTRRISENQYPFLKIYSKSLELLTSSLEFTQNYLKIDEIRRNPYTRRLEVTIKNKKMLDSLIKGKNFQNVITNDILKKQLILKIISKMEQEKEMLEFTKTYENSNAILCALINSLYQPQQTRKYNIEFILTYSLRYYKNYDKFVKSKLKRRITDIIEENLIR